MSIDLEQGLVIELQTIPNLNKKIFPLTAPENTTTPFVVYQKVGAELLKTLDGISRTRQAMYQLDLLAVTYAQLQDMFYHIKTKLIGFIGRTIGVNGVYIQDVTIETFMELYESQVKWYRMNMEVRIFYNEE